MSAWLSKWAPASGTLAGVLVAIAFFAAPPNKPGSDATGAQVIAWYGSHHTSDFVFDLIGGLAVLFLVLFAVALAWASSLPSVSIRFLRRTTTI